MNEEKTLESHAVNHGNKFCHPAYDDEQQQQAGIYEYILVRRAAACSIIVVIDHVHVLYCETAHGVYVPRG